jgi:hypothetical protein
MTVAPENMAAMSTVDSWIQRIQKLSDLPVDAAPDVAAAMRAETHRTIAASTTAYGQAWKPKQDGGKPLEHAAKAVGVAAVGDTIVMRVIGIEARHHKGTVRGKVARPIIPINGLPGRMSDQIRAVFEKHFGDLMSGKDSPP